MFGCVVRAAILGFQDDPQVDSALGERLLHPHMTDGRVAEKLPGTNPFCKGL